MRRRHLLVSIVLLGACLTPIGAVTAGHSATLPSVGEAVGVRTGVGGAAIEHPWLITNSVINVTKYELVVYVASPFCVATVKLKTADVFVAVGLGNASVKKNTPCGLASLKWTAAGPLTPTTNGFFGGITGIELYRPAKMTGTIGSTVFSLSASEGRIVLRPPV